MGSRQTGSGHIIGSAGNRSYHIQPQHRMGLIHRNRQHLRPVPGRESNSEEADGSSPVYKEEDCMGEQQEENPVERNQPAQSSEGTNGNLVESNQDQSAQSLRRSERVSRPPIRYDPSST